MTTLDTLIFNLVVENSIRVLEHVWNFIVVFVIFFIYMLIIVTCDVAMIQIQGKKKTQFDPEDPHLFAKRKGKGPRGQIETSITFN